MDVGPAKQAHTLYEEYLVKNGKVCPYCKKPFEPGQTLTSNENEDVVHLICEEQIEQEYSKKHI